MKDTQVVNPFLWLIKSQNSIFSSLAHIQKLLIFAKGQSSGSTETSEGQRPDALLLHIDDKEGTLRISRWILPKGTWVSEEDVSGVVAEDERVRAKERRPFVFIHKFSLWSISSWKWNDGLFQKISQVVAVFGIVEDRSSDLSVDLGKKFKLSFLILDDLSVERCKDECVLLLKRWEERRVDLEQLLGVSEWEEHIYNLSIRVFENDIGQMRIKRWK